MTREEAIKELKDFKDDSWDGMPEEVIDIAIKALEQEPCKDAISRQAVLVGLASIAKAKAKSDAQKSLMGRVMFFAERLPSVTPEPKIGHWIMTGDYHASAFGNIEYVKCSCCREYSLEEGNYCPNCGAKMQEDKE